MHASAVYQLSIKAAVSLSPATPQLEHEISNGTKPYLTATLNSQIVQIFL